MESITKKKLKKLHKSELKELKGAFYTKKISRVEFNMGIEEINTKYLKLMAELENQSEESNGMNIEAYTKRVKKTHIIWGLGLIIIGSFILYFWSGRFFDLVRYTSFPLRLLFYSIDFILFIITGISLIYLGLLKKKVYNNSSDSKNFRVFGIILGIIILAYGALLIAPVLLILSDLLKDARNDYILRFHLIIFFIKYAIINGIGLNLIFISIFRFKNYSAENIDPIQQYLKNSGFLGQFLTAILILFLISTTIAPFLNVRIRGPALRSEAYYSGIELLGFFGWLGFLFICIANLKIFELKKMQCMIYGILGCLMIGYNFYYLLSLASLIEDIALVGYKIEVNFESGFILSFLIWILICVIILVLIPIRKF